MNNASAATANVLLVDDREENLLALKAILGTSDYRLLTATSGEEALHLALREKLAVILLDVVMPVMDGYEVTKHLKAVERTKDIPIIFLTAFASDAQQIYRAYEVGAVDYLVKPLEAEVVRHKVAVFVNLVRQREEIERQGRLLLESERRNHQLRLAELRVASDARYRKLVEGIDHIVAWTANAEGQLTFVSRQAPGIIGYPIEEFLQPNFWNSHLHPEDKEAVWVAFRRSLAEQTDMSINHRVIGADGRVHWFHTGLSGEAGPKGGGELHGVSVDVTAIKRSEQAQALLAEVSSLLSSSLDYQHTVPKLAKLVVPALGDWCLIDEIINDGSCRHLAIGGAAGNAEAWLQDLQRDSKLSVPQASADEYGIHQPALHTVASDVSQLAEALHAGNLSALDAIKPTSYMVVPLRARNKTFGIATFIASAPRELNQSDLSLAEEVGRRAALAIENSLLHEEAQRATRAREELMAIVSHDLRTPLNSIVTSAGILEHSARQNGSATRNLKLAEAIFRSARRMESLINDLLDFAAIRVGQVTINPQTQAASSLIEESAEIFEPVAIEKEVGLQWNPKHAANVYCDTNRILQVLSNLLSNALKFTPPGGRVLLSLDTVGEEARFAVSDTGRGMSADELEHMWDFFWKAEHSSGGGVGLGLWISKGLVEAHGGRIWAESKPGQGTTVYFTLPLARESAGEQPTAIH